MDRNQFIIATAVILFAAFVLGWFASWLIHRLTRVTRADIGELERLAQALHDAEEARDEAIIDLETREGELKSKLVQAQAEARSSMDALRDKRAEVEELREYIEQQLSRMKAGRG